MAELYLTTLDNPYSPIKNPVEWEAWDHRNGYFTNEYIARVAALSDELSEEEEQLAIDQAMREIARINVTGNYVLIKNE